MISSSEIEILMADERCRKAYDNLHDAYEVIAEMMQRGRVTKRARENFRIARDIHNIHYEAYQKMKGRSE